MLNLESLSKQDKNRTKQLENTKLKLAAKEAEIEGLLKDHQRVQKEREALQRRLDEYQAAASSLSKEMLERNNEVSDWRDKCGKLSQEIRELKNKVTRAIS
ncbi:unnamed protein product [Notodromas monacha]|uniref:Uncharacterized protein n=1 Tax=Notodromas monacha TaxID=399045 RepID=A0A7R9BYZ4_9CRUS|nr:unnamed protein product [Notodromas monacha]CAG0922908.1 unnamed protein product [Notodromas monacha]